MDKIKRSTSLMEHYSISKMLWRLPLVWQFSQSDFDFHILFRYMNVYFGKMHRLLFRIRG